MADIEMETKPCPDCHGEGQVANDDDKTPWSYWENLRPGEDLAVQLGLIYSEPCQACLGSGRQFKETT